MVDLASALAGCVSGRKDNKSGRLMARAETDGVRVC